MGVLELLDGKDVLEGVIDVATDAIETPQDVAAVIAQAADYVPKEKNHRLHELRHGADAPRHRDEKARSALAGRGAGARKVWLTLSRCGGRGRRIIGTCPNAGAFPRRKQSRGIPSASSPCGLYVDGASSSRAAGTKSSPQWHACRPRDVAKLWSSPE